MATKEGSKNPQHVKRGGGRTRGRGAENSDQSIPVQKDVAATLKRLEKKDPGLGRFLDDAYGYAVFPRVGKAGVVVGGAYGRGVVYEQGEKIGYATMGRTSIGVTCCPGRCMCWSTTSFGLALTDRAQTPSGPWR